MLRMMMWSGGPDSTHALIRLLTETDDPVTVVYSYFINTNEEENELFQESPYMVKQTSNLKELKKVLEARYRPFDLLEITYRRRYYGLNAEAWILPIVYALQEPEFAFYDCRCAEDNEYGFYTKELGGRGILRDLKDLYGDLMDVREVGFDTPKHIICKELGDLWPLTWSCFYPTEEGQPCGNCQKCHDRKRAEQGLLTIDIEGDT